MIWALKLWMTAAIPLILAILPVTEIIDPEYLHHVAKWKFGLNWAGMGLSIAGITLFLRGLRISPCGVSGKNSQSWASFDIEIHSLTVVTRPSDVGKSALFRDLRGVVPIVSYPVQVVRIADYSPKTCGLRQNLFPS